MMLLRIITCAAMLWTLAEARAAEVKEGDEVTLLQDTKLIFRIDTVIRVAEKGERFKVLAVRPTEGQVYLSAKDALGATIAVHVADGSVAVVTPPALAEPPNGLPRLLQSRYPFYRAAAIAQGGGQPSGEAAVIRGLQYLARTQEPDGHWGKGAKPYVAATVGFSLLSFLGHGETPDSAEFGPTVANAVAWIVKNGEANDGHLNMEPVFNQAGVYAHAIVANALTEYYTMTRDPRVVELVKKAVVYIVKGQGPDGSWRYSYSQENKPDSSVTGWQMQALKAAHLSGLNIDGVEAALGKGTAFLAGMQGPKGGFGYAARGDGYSLTGVGVYCIYSWEGNIDKTVRSGIAFMLDETKKNYPVKYQHERANLYAWYYDTLACHAIGGETWQTWNRMFFDELVRAQGPDGSWPAMVGGGVADLQRAPDGIAPFYRTNLCLLMLEVYYRFTAPDLPHIPGTF